MTWETRDDFLFDKHTKLIGYQPKFEDLDKGSFIFIHNLCKATIEIKVAEFIDLYDGLIYQERYTGGGKCFRHCLHNDDLSACPAHCGCMYVRATIQIIKKWPKIK